MTFTGPAELQAQGSTPDAPVLFVVGRATEAVLYWKAPDDASITGWQYQRTVATGPLEPSNYEAWITITNADASTYTHTVSGLSGQQAQWFKIRAVNANGAGAASDGAQSYLESKLTTLAVTSSNPVTEGNSGTTAITLSVTLSENAPSGGVTFTIIPIASISSTTATVTYSTVLPFPKINEASPCHTRGTNDDVCLASAHSAADDVDISAGSNSATFSSYFVVGDTRDEGDEVVFFRLVGLGWSDSVARLVITDDDGPTSTHTPGPTSTHTPGPTSTHTPGPTSTHTPGPTNTHTPGPTNTHTPGPTSTHTPGPTNTHTPGPTSTHTPGRNTGTSVPLFRPTSIPVPPRTRLAYLRTDTLISPTTTPVVQCPAPRRSP